jgi:hypothetical protein
LNARGLNEPLTVLATRREGPMPIDITMPVPCSISATSSRSAGIGLSNVVTSR